MIVLWIVALATGLVVESFVELTDDIGVPQLVASAVVLLAVYGAVTAWMIVATG